MKSTVGCVRFRDGHLARRDVLSIERKQLIGAGFRAHTITLTRADGSSKEADLWTQDQPTLSDMLNAVQLLFDGEPGSLAWDAPCP